MDFSGKVIAEGVVALAVAIAIIAGIVDWRHRKREDLDRVALLDWRSVQVFALIAAIVAFSVAVNVQ